MLPVARDGCGRQGAEHLSSACPVSASCRAPALTPPWREPPACALRALGCWIVLWNGGLLTAMGERKHGRAQHLARGLWGIVHVEVVVCGRLAMDGELAGLDLALDPTPHHALD